MKSSPIKLINRQGLALCFGAETLAGIMGFASMIHLARHLEAPGFARLEIAMATAGWLLVMVRGGLDQVVVREAAKHPRLINSLSIALMQLRFVWAILASLIVAIVATMSHDPSLVFVAGLILIPSVLVADIGPKACNKLGFLAAIQAIKACAIMLLTIVLIHDSRQILLAASIAALAESIVAIITLIHQPISWTFRFRKRLALILSSRAIVAGLTRFGRVGLYAIDAIALRYAAESTGEYAGVRRIIFAMLSIGIVLPAILAPNLARSRTCQDRSKAVAQGLRLTLELFVPAAVGLSMIVGPGIEILFGPSFDGHLPFMVLVVARLPIMLVATWLQSALVAFGHDRLSLRLVTVTILFALAVLPVATYFWGVYGIAVALLCTESIMAVGGVWILKSLGIMPFNGIDVRPILLGCLAMLVGLNTLGFTSVFIKVIIGMIIYGIVWMLARTLFIGRAGLRLMSGRPG